MESFDLGKLHLFVSSKTRCEAGASPPYYGHPIFILLRCIHEEMLPSFLDLVWNPSLGKSMVPEVWPIWIQLDTHLNNPIHPLFWPPHSKVIWGHEHDCQVKPQDCPEVVRIQWTNGYSWLQESLRGEFYVIQPGSSVWSLAPMWVASNWVGEGLDDLFRVVWSCLLSLPKFILKAISLHSGLICLHSGLGFFWFWSSVRIQSVKTWPAWQPFQGGREGEEGHGLVLILRWWSGSQSFCIFCHTSELPHFRIASFAIVGGRLHRWWSVLHLLLKSL